MFYENIKLIFDYKVTLEEGLSQSPENIISLIQKKTLFRDLYRNIFYPTDYKTSLQFLYSKNYNRLDLTNNAYLERIRNVYLTKIREIYKGNDSLIIKNLSRKNCFSPYDTINTLTRLERIHGINFRSKKIPFNSRKEYDKYIQSMYVKEFSKKHHDEVSSLYLILTTRNEKLSYSNNEKALQTTKDDLKIYLPKDTQTLREVGRDMNICVGSYDRKAKNKHCTIVLLDKGNEHYICMELRENEVVQVKKKNNYLVKKTEPEWKFLYKWMKDNKLNCHGENDWGDFDGPTNEFRQLTSFHKSAPATEPFY